MWLAWARNLLSSGPIGVDFGRIVGIPTPARVETIDKRVVLEAECMPNGWRSSNDCHWWSRFDHWATRRQVIDAKLFLVGLDWILDVLDCSAG